MHILLLLVACRSESALEKTTEGGPVGFDSGTTPSLPEETCNGVDDDADGEVDEGFADADGNGRVDCLDAECPALEVADAGEAVLTDACLGTGPEDPWDIVYEARNLLMPTGTGSFPALGHLDDDNGDGVLGVGDVPEIAVSNIWARELVVMELDGTVRWVMPEANDTQNATIADVDLDGSPDVIAISAGREVVALDASGVEIWRTPAYASEIMYYMGTGAADLDGDGDVEVVADGLLLEGATGALIRDLTEIMSYRTPVFADLDLDGEREIILGSEVFDARGDLLWSTDPPEGLVFAAVVDVDLDGEPEVVFTNNDVVAIHAADGTRLATLTQYTNRMGPPCVADFDGDGAPELGLANGGRLSVLEFDGTELWSGSSLDLSGYAGCSAYDFDQDGSYELLFAGENEFAIYDGRTGIPRFEDRDHTSLTLWEYPVVADVDADGAAEIVVIAASGVNQGVNVYGHRTGAWPSPGSTWCSHDFAVTNSPEDCSAVDPPAPSWREGGNMFRARPAPPIEGRPDLVVDVSDACVADCTYGPVGVALVVENRGAVDVDGGVLLELLAVDDPDSRVVWSQLLPPVPAGTRLAGIEVALRPEDVGTLGFAARIDGEARVDECDEANNRVERLDLGCPR